MSVQHGRYPSMDARTLRLLIAADGRPKWKVAHEAGMSSHRISRVAFGHATANEREVKALAKALGVKVSDLNGGTCPLCGGRAS